MPLFVMRLLIGEQQIVFAFILVTPYLFHSAASYIVYLHELYYSVNFQEECINFNQRGGGLICEGGPIFMG